MKTAFVTLMAFLLALNGLATEHRHCDCCTSSCADHHSNWIWQPVSELPKDSGFYYLTRDIEISETWVTCMIGEIHLCLNGHTIRSSSERFNGRFYYGSGGSLILTDCQPTPGAIIGPGMMSEEPADVGGFTLVKYRFDLHRITIENWHARIDGGGVYVESGAVFNLHSGMIRNCRTDGSGGGVCTRGTFTMSGGTITNCTAKVGGGVRMRKGAFTLTGGTIAGNRSNSNGNGVQADGLDGACTITMTGGRISNNSDAGTGSPGGGGLLLWDGVTATISGGEICVNSTANGGGGILIGGNKGGGKLIMTSGIVRGNRASVGAAIHRLSGVVSVAGGVFDRQPPQLADGYESVAVREYYAVAQAGTAASGNGILTAGRYRFDPLDASYMQLSIASSQNFYTTVVEKDPTVWQLTAQKAIDCATWPEVRANLSVGNDVHVCESMTVKAPDQAVTLPTARTYNLDLGGHAITSMRTEPLFDLQTAGATLKVVGDGTVVNGATGAAAHNGGCFNVATGSLEIAGGTYAGFRVAKGYDGGCVHVGEGASFILTDGVISNCWAGGAGGAVASRGSCGILGGRFTRNSSTAPGGAVAALDGEMLVSGGEFAANGTTAQGDAAPTNGAALAVADSATLRLSGGWFRDNVTSAPVEAAGSGAAVYLRLNPAGSALILGGLFGANRMGTGDERRNVLVDPSRGGDDVLVAGGFFFRQDPLQTLGAYMSAEIESVPVRANWWALGFRDTIRIANDRVYEGTFTFDPKGEPCYVLENLVTSGARTIYTPPSGDYLGTWQLTCIADETLYFEGRCLLPDGTAPTGVHLFRTYLATADGELTSETNHVAVQLDANGYYASQTSLDTCGFIEKHGEAYLAIDIYTADGETLVQREPRQKIGFVPYALHASRAESVKLPSLTAESLAVSNSARIGTLTVSSALTVTKSIVVTNGATGVRGKVSKMTIDWLNLAGAGTSLLEPVGAMPLDPSARAGWTRVATSTTGVVNPRDGVVVRSVSCPCDGLVLIACSTAGAGALDLKVTQVEDFGQEEVFSRNGLVAADGKGYDLSLPVVRGNKITIQAKATGEGMATVAYKYVTFGAPREEM